MIKDQQAQIEKNQLTVGAKILQKYTVFVPDYLVLKVRDVLDPFFAEVALLYNVVPDAMVLPS